MGQITNPIAMHLALTTLWRYLFVGDFDFCGYKNFVLSSFIITKICKHFFSNYSIPETLLDKPRNDKTLEQKERNLQGSLITNSFVMNNMIHGSTTVIKQKGLLITVDILDADLLAKKVNEIKDLKKTESSYVTPKPWKRRLAQSLMQYITLLRNRKNVSMGKFVIKRKKLTRIIAKSFRWSFRGKKIMQNLQHDPAQKKHYYSFKEKIFFRPRNYILKKTEKVEYYVFDAAKEEKQDETEEDQRLLVDGLENLKKNKMAFYFFSTVLFNLEPLEVAVKSKRKGFWMKLLKVLKKTISIATLFVVKNKLFGSKKIRKVFSKKTKGFRKKRKHQSKTLGRNVYKLKRYPLIYQPLLKKQKNALQIAPKNLPWTLLKSLISSFSMINQTEKKQQNFWFITWKNMMAMLWRFIDNIPKTICSRMLTAMIVNVESQMIAQRSNFFAERYLVYQISNAALFAAVRSIYKNNDIHFSFVGKHTRNMSAQMLVNYIVTKLGQYFTVQEIVKPISFDLKTSPFFSGFKLMVVGRVTRKERAAFMLKQFGTLPLNKFSAMIDYAAESKIMKFGMVGIKALLNKIKTNSSYYNFRFFNLQEKIINYNLIFLLVGIIIHGAGMVALQKIVVRNFYTTSKWHFGRPYGKSGLEEAKIAAKAAGIPTEEMLSFLANNIPYNPWFGVPMFTKDLSNQLHALEAKVFDKEFMIVSISYTCKSMISVNTFEKQKETYYMGPFTLMGQPYSQFYLPKLCFMPISQWHAYNEEQFLQNSAKLFASPMAKEIRPMRDEEVENLGRQAYAFHKKHFPHKYARTEYAKQERYKSYFLQQEQYNSSLARIIQSENAIIVIQNNYEFSKTFVNHVRGCRIMHHIRKRMRVTRYATQSNANGDVITYKNSFTVQETIRYSYLYSVGTQAEQKTIQGLSGQIKDSSGVSQSLSRAEEEDILKMLREYYKIIDQSFNA